MSQSRRYISAINNNGTDMIPNVSNTDFPNIFSLSFIKNGKKMGLTAHPF
jgi:hypothetical protein